MFHHKGRTQSWRSSQSRTVNISRRGMLSLGPVEVALYSILRNHCIVGVWLLVNAIMNPMKKLDSTKSTLQIRPIRLASIPLACLPVRNDSFWYSWSKHHHIISTSCRHLCGLNGLSVQLDRPHVVVHPSKQSRATWLSWEEVRLKALAVVGF